MLSLTVQSDIRTVPIFKYYGSGRIGCGYIDFFFQFALRIYMDFRHPIEINTKHRFKHLDCWLFCLHMTFKMQKVMGVLHDTLTDLWNGQLEAKHVGCPLWSNIRISQSITSQGVSLCMGGPMLPAPFKNSPLQLPAR